MSMSGTPVLKISLDKKFYYVITILYERNSR